VPTNASIRKQITEQIVQAMEHGVKPWRRPWTVSPNAGRPNNVVSRQPYNGINPLLLELHRLEHGFSSKWYATYRQWERLDCQVMKRPDHVEKGRWGCQIVFYKPVTKRHVDPATGQEEEDRFFVMRTWTVFSADQVEGAEEFRTEEYEPASVPDFEPADELIAATGGDIRHHGDRAFYKRPIGPWPDHHDGDFIIVPHKHRFDPVGSYYETVLHELGHWSEVRLGWDHKEHGYAMGELVAEMASSFLATELGVPQGETLENHAAYLKSWLKDMKDDPAFTFRASTQASKVCDYLLAFTQREAVAA
jgi:antirestriction protein ArdC